MRLLIAFSLFSISLFSYAETCFVTAKAKCTSSQNNSKQVYFTVKGELNGRLTGCGDIKRFEVADEVRAFVEDTFFRVVTQKCKFQTIQGVVTSLRFSTRGERDRQFTKMRRDCVRSYSAASCFAEEWNEFRL